MKEQSTTFEGLKRGRVIKEVETKATIAPGIIT